MERKKILTIVLLTAVTLIWGVIILRVARGSSPSVASPVVNMPEKSQNRKRKDTVNLDYRDPFLGEFVRANDRNKMKAVTQARLVRKEQEPPESPDFTYKGLIGNGSGQRAVVLKNGNLNLLRIGDTFEEFKVVEIFPEYMIVQSGKYQMEIKVR